MHSSVVFSLLLLATVLCASPSFAVDAGDSWTTDGAAVSTLDPVDDDLIDPVDENDEDDEDDEDDLTFVDTGNYRNGNISHSRTPNFLQAPPSNLKS
jgi:hypothetical protein